jgi:hypothetical protein
MWTKFRRLVNIAISLVNEAVVTVVQLFVLRLWNEGMLLFSFSCSTQIYC